MNNQPTKEELENGKMLFKKNIIDTLDAPEVMPHFAIWFDGKDSDYKANMSYESVTDLKVKTEVAKLFMKIAREQHLFELISLKGD